MPKITALTADTAPTSDDLAVIVNDPAGTPGTKKATLANVITKAHGLSDGIVSASTGTLNSTLSLDTDVTLAADSNTKIPSQKAVKTYTDNILGSANALVYKGTIDCSANPNYPAGDAGFLYVVSVAGKIGGASGIEVEVGDMAICNTDGTVTGDQATVGTFWNIIQKNIVGAVTGPASSVVDNVALFDGTTGKIIKDAGAKLSDYIAKSIIDAKGDLIVGSADNTPAILTSSATDGDILTVDTTTSTGLAWTTPGGGGGQSTYDYIVGPLETYTTLGAVLAVASNGNSIFIKSGTYSESAITTALTGLKIVGESVTETILNITSNNLVFSGADVSISDFAITSTTGNLTFSGARFKSERNKYSITSNATDRLTVSGADAVIDKFWFADSSTGTTRKINFSSTRGVWKNSLMEIRVTVILNTTESTFQMSGINQQIINNKFITNATSANNTTALSITNSRIKFSNNYCQINYTNSGNFLYIINGSSSIIDNNTFDSSDSNQCGILFAGTSNSLIISNNTMTADQSGSALPKINMSGITDSVITGNRITSNIITGAISTQGASNNITISGNSITGNSARAIGFGQGSFTVTGNYLKASTNIFTFGNDTSLSVTGNIFEVPNNAIRYADSSVDIPLICKNNLGNYNELDIHDYKRMKNTSGGTLTEGQIVVLKNVAGLDEVTTTTTAGDNKVFGIVIKASISNNAIGNIKTEGRTTKLKVDGTTDIAIGDYISAFTTAGIGQKASSGDTAIAIALEAYTTDDSNGVIDAKIISPLKI